MRDKAETILGASLYSRKQTCSKTRLKEHLRIKRNNEKKTSWKFTPFSK
jgi:hypothetical protein